MHPAINRVRQGVLALMAGFRPAAGLPPEIDVLLTPAQRETWRSLPAVERAHLARVGGILHANGARDPDLLVAAVLHDIGKHPGGTSVRLPHRVLRVLLERMAPRVIEHLRGASGVPTPLRPLWLSVHHARLGAMQAAAIGCSARSCWLIAHHEDPPPIPDRDLAALQHADDLA